MRMKNKRSLTHKWKPLREIELAANNFKGVAIIHREWWATARSETKMNNNKNKN